MTRVTRGFTLIELAIVLVIITILIGGLAVPLSAQIQARRIAETNKTLEEAREAIIGYAMTHKSITTNKPYLPCPDSDATADGVENRDAITGICAQNVGWFPWVTLGTAAQDAWGNRLLYQVTASFSKSDGFSNTDTGDLQICSTNGCALVDVASNVPAVLVSYGPNGWGGRNVSGTSLKAPTSADELENTDADVNIVSRAPTKVDSASGEFDDLVVWLADGLLRSRVCPAGGCP
ncbi:MAG: prepilin-type N-terminal cleavage/methylation domain-containing protein [Thiobacillus sp.]|nr:prepilin-type N-terminal cleavage/methylation domain-containing protein [Thiobacillus sp.]